MHRSSLATLLSALFFAVANAADVPQATTQLPRTVRPTHYDVAITPNAKALTFSGKVTIAIEVLEQTNSITLHALDLVIGSATLTGSTGAKSFGTPKITLNAAEQTATFAFGESLSKGSYKLAIDYQGKIGTQAFGIFAIDYDTEAGPKRAIYTQFEAADARRMIPSWDEPSFKTTYTLEAVVPSDQMAVSNMPVAQKIDAGSGRTRVKFATSPKMSSYLLFLGVGEFDRITTKAGPTEIGVITQKGASSQGQFALDSSRAVLQEYNDYFAIPYPLPKLDNIASPGRSQFFGAMENWGAIYTFEYAILVNPAISTQADKQSSFRTAAHEIAHQWFGNLVTMSWWDDLWLNEGFATWMAGRTTEKLHPEWNTVMYKVDGRENAISRDSLATTHPVVQKVLTVEQANQAFDAITYQKGSAVIRMLEEYVGADAWREGVREYIRKHAYGNTVSDDLWREIEVAAKKPVLAIAHDFTLQPGVPLLKVAAPTCANNSTTLQFEQTEFSKDQPNKKPLTWRVPVIVQPAGKGASVRTVIENGKGTITVPGCGAAIVNAGQSGYYRTLYSPAHFAQIKSGYSTFAPVDQLGILTDTWTLGLAGYRNISDTFELAAVTHPQADPKIWETIASVFEGVDDYYRSDAVRAAKFRSFALAKLKPILDRVGWVPRKGEMDAEAILRQELIRVMSSLDDPTVIAEAQRRYRASKSDAAAIPPALRKTILRTVARHADTATWEELRTQAKNEKTALIKDEMYGLLAIAKDETLARRALDLALTSEPGATNSAAMISRVSGMFPDQAFDFAMKNIKAIDTKVDGSARSGFYAGLSSSSLDPAMVGKIKAYADAHVAKESRRDADTAIARIQYRIKIKNERLASLEEWLAKRS